MYIERDAELDRIAAIDTPEALGELLSLLVGERLKPPSGKDDPTRREILNELVEGIASGLRVISYEQLNEMLLLYGANRISRSFFNYFFVERLELRRSEAQETLGGTSSSQGEAGFGTSDRSCASSGTQPERGPSGLRLQDLKDGILEFRAAALLRYGNFRFAFKQLSEPQRGVSHNDAERLISRLAPWSDTPEERRSGLLARPAPVLPIEGSPTKVSRDDSWHLGYLSVDLARKDYAAALALDAHTSGGSLDDALSRLKTLGEIADERALEKHLRAIWSRAEKQSAPSWKDRLPQIYSSALALLERIPLNWEKGRRNTIKYLTWDYLDVYVATSMREPWEFEETYDIVSEVFSRIEPELGLRWFDPTQSFENSPVDKGLLESLMLKRAKCTLYLAQELDTLGKDSELAATLAQGKPVVVFLPKIEPQELAAFREKIARRSLRFLRTRMSQLLAEDHFLAKRDSILRNLSHLGWSRDDAERLLSSAEDFVIKLYRNRPMLELVPSGERNEVLEELGGVDPISSLLAAAEAAKLNSRGDLYTRFHPLAVQVHLESGVANGLLVARSIEEAARLIRGIVLNDLRFEIGPIEDETQRKRIGLALYEVVTGNKAKFRVVTDHEILTNSFWSFYLKNSN